MKNRTRSVVLYATLGALIFAAMTLDRAITPFLPLSAAFVTLTVTFTFALVKPNLATAVASGIIFGVSSCITAIFFGKSSVINPLISILPRAFLGFIVYGVYALCRMIFRKAKPKTREIASVSIAAAVTTAMNTVLFLSALVLFGENNTIDSVFKITVLANAVPELVMTAVLVPAVTLGVRRGLGINIGGATAVPSEAIVSVDTAAEAKETDGEETAPIYNDEKDEAATAENPTDYGEEDKRQ